MIDEEFAREVQRRTAPMAVKRTFSFSADELRAHAAEFFRAKAWGEAPTSPVAGAVANELRTLADFVKAHDPEGGFMRSDRADPQQPLNRAFNTSELSASVAEGVAGIGTAAFDSAVGRGLSIARPTPVPDFRDKSFPTLGFGSLEVLADGVWETPSITLAESASLETTQLDSRTTEIVIGRRAVLANQTTLLAQVGEQIGQAVARTTLKSVAGVLEATGNLSDGSPWFDATIGNLVDTGAGAAPSEATLNAGLKALRGLTNPAGEVAGVGGRFLVVPPALEITGRKLLKDIYEPGDPERLVLVVNPWLTSDTAWYIMPDPVAAPALVLLYLEGNQQRPFYVEGLRTRRNGGGIRMAVQADYAFMRVSRFAFKNAGV